MTESRMVKKLRNFHGVSSRGTLEGRERPLSDEFTTNCVACQFSESLRVGKTGLVNWVLSGLAHERGAWRLAGFEGSHIDDPWKAGARIGPLL